MPPRKKTPLPDLLPELTAQQRKEQARLYARKPKRIGDVVNQVMARNGYARIRSSADLAAAWQEAAGEFASRTRVGRLQRGVLEVIACNSTVVQELTFARPALLATLARLAPDQPIRTLRFRTGPLK